MIVRPLPMASLGATLCVALLAGPAIARQQGGDSGPVQAMTGSSGGGSSSESGSGDESDSGSGGGGSGSGSGGGPEAMYSEPYFKYPSLNDWMLPIDPPPGLETPQASLANFIDSCDAGDYDRAARSLNLSEIDRVALTEDLEGLDRAALAAELARRLRVVQEQKVWPDWEGISDRPDGEIFGITLQKKLQGESAGPTRAVNIGTIKLDGRDIDLWLERVKAPDAEPVWVFSKQTVHHIPALFETFGPSPLEERLPGALRAKVAGIAAWQWIGVVLFLALSYMIGRIAQGIIAKMLRRSPSSEATDLAWAVRGPVALIVGLIVFQILATSVLRLSGPVMALVEPLIFVAIVLAVAWLASKIIDYASAELAERYEGEERGSESQAMLTRIRVGKHFFTVLVVIFGLCFALWQFEWFKAIGIGLLASAGIAALVLGLAAQRPLGNLFAGVQLAITQPVRVGDAVIFQGEWGWIEQIDITYVVIRTWDMRRLVVPTAHMMDTPIENWTKGGENMTKPVYLYADYRVDFAAVRDEFERILEGSDDWDEEVPPILQVTNCTDETVELRALCSAKDPSVAWNLHCDVRERLVAFLRDLDDGAYLPRTRVAMVDDSSSDGEADGDSSADRGRPKKKGGRSKSKAKASKAADENKIGGSDRGDGDGDGEEG